VGFASPDRERPIVRLRWAGVLPAAVLSSLAIEFVANLGFRAITVALGRPAQSALVSYLLLLLFYVPKESAFVIAGAKVAPGGRFWTAMALAAMRLLLSLATHVLTQSHRGAANYLHLALEWTGALLGVWYVASTSRRR
jgi:hypothetical protein